MLKKTIKYVGYDGEEKSKTCYFNLTTTELREMKRSPLYEVEKIIEKIESLDNPDEELSYEEKDEYQEKIGELLRNLIIQAYGVKSEDGERFVKRSGNRRYGMGEDFIETMAYDALYTELISEFNNVVFFIRGIIPPEYRQNIDDAIKENA